MPNKFLLTMITKKLLLKLSLFLLTLDTQRFSTETNIFISYP